MAASTLSLTLSSSDRHRRQSGHRRLKPHHPGLLHFTSPPLDPNRLSFRIPFSSSSPPPSPLPPPPSPPTPTPLTPTSDPIPFLDDPYRTQRFLTNRELDNLKALEAFTYHQELRSGSLHVRVMRADEMDETVNLLAESFAESMLFWSSPGVGVGGDGGNGGGYVALLRFLVKQYLIERRSVMPHAATLVGFYKSKDEDDGKGGGELAGTVEVCFDKRGSNASPPSPTPPRDSAYICNMTVKQQLRRRGIGWHLLKGCEELISRISSSKEVYLHCRMIDLVPFNMYTKAGYRIVKTDNILVLLTFQRRKHLMGKELPLRDSPSESHEMGPNQEQFL